ncbi:MAG: ABC transporter substrate-binding protein, partial [Trueperaceae bacterium]
ATAFIAIINEGMNLKAVAAVQQNTLAAVIALESSGIRTPKDLAGRTFADSAGSTNRILLPAYAAAAGFDASTVEFVAAAPPDLPRLLASKTVDFIGQFVVGRSLIETAAGEPAVIFPYSDYLPNLYGNLILASTDMIEKQPEVVKAFVGALMRGLAYSIDHPEETGAILVKYADGQNADIAADEVRIMHDYVLPPGFTGPIGSIDPAKVNAMIQLLTEAGAITKPGTADDVYAPGFLGQ